MIKLKPHQENWPQYREVLWRRLVRAVHERDLVSAAYWARRWRALNDYLTGNER